MRHTPSVRYVVTGQHPIDVAAGRFEPGATDVPLTDAEAAHLLRAGSVSRVAVPAVVAETDLSETSGLSETKPSGGRKDK